MAELKVLMLCAQLPEESALLECRVSVRAPAAGRVRAGSGGPQRLQVWGPGPPGHHWTPAASLQGREVSQLGVLARAGGESQRWRRGNLALSGSPQALFGKNPAFILGISCGEAGSALEGGGGHLIA